MNPTVESFDTCRIPQRQRVEYWNQAARRAFDAIRVRPDPRGFTARLCRRSLGALQLTSVHSSATEVEGSTSERLGGIYLLASERGQFEVQQRGRRGLLLPGGLTVLYPHEPYRLACSAALSPASP